MNIDAPKVSVVMPVYKGDKHLSDSINSILNQTFSNLEFIIICDDPTDETRNILDKYQQNDSRVKIYYQGRQGLVNSLNKGISVAEGEYIARMDADDISLPDRLEKQVEFMNRNPEIGICGSWVKTIGDLSGLVWIFPCDHETIQSRMLFETVIAHPSIIARRDLFLNNGFAYKQEELYAEDYGLWVRAAKETRLANIPKILLHYRIHESTSDRNKQKYVANNIRLAQIKELGINPTEEEFKIHEALSYYVIHYNRKFILEVIFWLEKLRTSNFEMKIYPEPAFSTVLGQQLYFVCKNSTYLGFDSWNLFNESKLSKSVGLSIAQKTKFLLKCIIK